MNRTVVLRRDYLHYIKKYNRFEKRHHNLPAHLSPVYHRTRIGDIVTVGCADPFPRRLDSTPSELRRSISKVTLERPSSCSEHDEWFAPKIRLWFIHSAKMPEALKMHERASGTLLSATRRRERTEQFGHRYFVLPLLSRKWMKSVADQWLAYLSVKRIASISP